MTQTTENAMPVSPQQDAVRLWLYVGRLYAELQQLETEPEKKKARERARELVRDVGNVKDADPIVRGRILQALEAVERDPSSAPDLLKAVAAASCSCLNLVPGVKG